MGVPPRLAAWELGADRGFYESKALLGVSLLTKSAQNFKDLFTERRMFSSVTGSLAEPSFLKDRDAPLLVAPLKEKGVTQE